MRRQQLLLFDKMSRLYFLDMDGVLAIPYSMPEQPYAHTIVLLQSLHAAGHTLCAVSFNPRAYTVLRAWGVEHLFTAIRAGCNQPWSGDKADYSDETHRIDISKSNQISDILTTELRNIPHDSVWFYDDDPVNIGNVGMCHPNIVTWLVDHREGWCL